MVKSKEIFTDCTLCYHSCGTKVTVEDGKAVKIRGLESHPLNKGRLCPKGAKAQGGRRKVTISWEANPEADITRYQIYKKTPFGFKKKGSTQGLSYTDGKLKDGKTYTYKITAVDKDGLESPFSQEVSATTAPK